jgi:hypothetical protein
MPRAVPAVPHRGHVGGLGWRGGAAVVAVALVHHQHPLPFDWSMLTLWM